LAKADKIAAVKLPPWARALDALAIIMAILTLSVAIFGGFRITVFGLRLSMTDWSRPGLWCVLALIARHAVLRRDPVWQRVAAGVTAWRRHPDTRTVLPIHLVSRLGVIIIGLMAVFLIGFPPEATKRWSIYQNDLLDLPARWDTGWYLTIANEGYLYRPDTATEFQQNIAFFPAFPMSMRYLSTVLGRHTLWTGVLISIVAFYLALGYFLRLARSELGDEDQAVTAVTLLAAYPFAVFFSAAYTEGLFLLTLVAAVYHFRHDQLWRSAFWGFICGLTRPPGCFLSVVLGLMALRSAFARSTTVDRSAFARSATVDRSAFAPGAGADRPPIAWGPLMRRLLAASAPGFGMLAFSAFIYQLTGNAFQWTMQNAAWGRVYKGLDEIVTDRIDFIVNNGLYSYVSTQTIDLMYSLTVVLCLAAVWPVYRRFGLPYAVFILLNVLPPMSAGGMLSMGRVTAVVFPVFLWLGAAVPARRRTAWIIGFALLQGFVAVMFFTWRPLY
jgi:hypothetical protein